MILDEKLSFREHIAEALTKAKSGLSLMKYLAKYINREKLDMTYKMYVRPHLEYGDVIFHDSCQDMMDLIESIQYQAGLIVTGCWKGTSRLKLLNELGWELLSERRRFHRLSLYYKIKNKDAPEYLQKYVLTSAPEGTERYKRTFFPYCYKHWETVDESLKNIDSLDHFKSKLIKSIRPIKSPFFKVLDRYGLSLLTRLRVDFSDLREHRFDHNFNCPDPTCKCELEVESSEHFLLRCPRFVLQRKALLETISNVINPGILTIPHDHLARILLFGSTAYNEVANRLIIEATIIYIKKSKRFKVLEAYTQD